MDLVSNEPPINQLCRNSGFKNIFTFTQFQQHIIKNSIRLTSKNYATSAIIHMLINFDNSRMNNKWNCNLI